MDRGSNSRIYVLLLRRISADREYRFAFHNAECLAIFIEARIFRPVWVALFKGDGDSVRQISQVSKN